MRGVTSRCEQGRDGREGPVSLGDGASFGGDGNGLVGSHGAKPAGGEPGLRDREFGPAAIEADADVGRG